MQVTSRTVESSRPLVAWILGSTTPIPGTTPQPFHPIPNLTVYIVYRIYRIYRISTEPIYIQYPTVLRLRLEAMNLVFRGLDLSSLTMSSACDCHLFYHVGGRSEKWAWLLVGRYESLISSLQPYPENSEQGYATP